MAFGMAVTGGFSQLLDKTYRKVFFDEYTRTPEEFSKVANITTEGKAHYIREGEMSGLGAMVVTPEGHPLSFDSPKQGNDKTVYFKKFTLGFQITEEMRDDDLTGHMSKIPKELGKSASYTRELEFWDIFNTGFVSTYRAALDGLPLFDDAHTSIDNPGTTFDNEGTAGSLSMTTLQAALNHFELLKNDRGIPIVMVPKMLIIPPALKWVAKKLLLSEFEPGTADNDINVLRDEGLKYMVSHYLTSTTAYYVLTDKADHDLRFIWRKPVSFNSWDDPNTGNAMFSARCRFVTTFFSWRGCFGNAGA